jgi:hypothetical protein
MVDPPLQVLHERTGWWEAEGWSTAWHVEQAAGIAKDAQRAELRPRSSGTLEIRIQGLFGGGSALRGRVRTVKVETEAVLRLRAIAHSLGVPPRWQMLPKPRLVELPQVAIQRSATSAAGAATVAAPPPTPTSATAGVNSATALSAASDGAGEIVAPGGLQFRNASIGTVLDLYAVLANAQLEVDARVRASRATFSLTNTEALSQTGAMRLLEQVLEQQGGIVIQRVDSQHVRVIPIEAQAAKRDSK